MLEGLGRKEIRDEVLDRVWSVDVSVAWVGGRESVTIHDLVDDLKGRFLLAGFSATDGVGKFTVSRRERFSDTQRMLLAEVLLLGAVSEHVKFRVPSPYD